jgi:4a-hydroxytetrahydrobiopterin dehydratase
VYVLLRGPAGATAAITVLTGLGRNRRQRHTGAMEKLTATDIVGAQLGDWRKLAQALHARFLTGNFLTGLELVTAIAEAAEQANHHPDVTLTYPYVDVKLISHDVSRVTQRDIDLARRISGIARERGIGGEPSSLSQCELALDVADLALVGPFWAALLTGRADALVGDDVVDPQGRVPLLWFQHTEAHETPRQRFHLDLWVPQDVAGGRIAAAVAAGGRVIDDSAAPSYVVMADPEGNKACVCTFLDR